jgi:hypothetical protein
MSTMRFEIGQRLTITPVEPGKGNRWIAECSELPEDWSCEFLHRAEMDLVPLEPITGWVFWIEPSRHQVQVSDSNFGFLPISDRMRPRYVTSLRRLAALLKGECELNQGDADVLSEVKGMFSRCARRDQWDWRAVHLALGEPTRAVAREFATNLGKITAALREGDIKSAMSHLEPLRSSKLTRLAQAAADTIADSAPSIAGSRVVTGQRRSDKRESAEFGARTVLSSYSKKKLDSANATHAELLDVLGSFLGVQGHRIEANQFVDAFTRLKSGPAIFEAKSVTDKNELSQVRHGLSQLYEYRFRHGLEDASLWLLLSRPPKEAWLVDYLERDRDVRLLWVEEGALNGPSVDRLLESGSDAIRRQGEAE